MNRPGLGARTTRRRGGGRLLAPTVALAAALLPARPITGDYRFLGELLSYETTPSGASVRCAPDARLQIRFLTPSILRVTLVRPDADAVLLELPIVRAEWLPVAVRVEEGADRLTIRSDSATLVVHRTPCRLTWQDRGGATLADHDSAMAIGWDGNEVRSWYRIADGDRFYGLGEKTGTLDKRGEQWTLWNSDTYAYGPSTDPIYLGVPFFVGLRDDTAFGVYLNNSARSTFNFGAGNHRYYSFAADQGPLDYFLILGPSVASVVARYTELTGRMPLPPAWGLGFQQSRWSCYPAAEVLRIARTFREKRIPADVMYLDIDYMDGHRVFTWDRQRFPDPAGMLRELRQLGFKVVTMIDPAPCGRVSRTSPISVGRRRASGGAAT
jgi:alpha-glucosidase